MILTALLLNEGARFFAVLFGLRFYRHSLFGRPSGDAIVLFLVFTFLSTNPTPFGDSIFLLVKKDRGERHAKGLQSRPLESCFYTGVRRGDVRTSYEFAVMQLTRFRPVRGVLRTASTDSIVLRPEGEASASP